MGLRCASSTRATARFSNLYHMTMIEIHTAGDVRTYRVPRAVAEVAITLFGVDVVDSVFAMARRLVADDLHTVEQIALNVGHDAAVSYALNHMVERGNLWSPGG